MQGESITAPTLPPPLPKVGPPLLTVLGPVVSPQQESAPDPDSSKTTRIMPRF